MKNKMPSAAVSNVGGLELAVEVIRWARTAGTRISIKWCGAPALCLRPWGWMMMTLLRPHAKMT